MSGELSNALSPKNPFMLDHSMADGAVYKETLLRMIMCESVNHFTARNKDEA